MELLRAASLGSVPDISRKALLSLHMSTAFSHPELPDGSGVDHEAVERDSNALRRLFEAHYEELCRFAYRYVGAAEESRDIVQEVFLRLWQRRTRLELQQGLRTYLYTLVRNLSLDRLRHRRVERRYTAPRLIEEGPAWVPDPEQDLISDEVSAAIRRAVEALPPRQREIIGLRWREGASYERIAAQLGISEKTVGNHITRAMEHLRRSLGRLLEGG